jgi:hypothetical protein
MPRPLKTFLTLCFALYLATLVRAQNSEQVIFANTGQSQLWQKSDWDVRIHECESGRQVFRILDLVRGRFRKPLRGRLSGINVFLWDCSDQARFRSDKRTD